MAVRYKDYYEILGVERAASQDEIRKAYRKRAKQYHPDVSKDKDADARYKEINEAYEVLKDPEKRRRYDTLGAGWQQGQDFTPPPGWQGGGGEYAGEWASFSDFFKTIFAGINVDGANFDARGADGIFRGARGRSRDSEVELELSLEEMARGDACTLSLRSRNSRNCFAPQVIHVNLPRGVTKGSRIRLAGKAPDGGDLYVTLRVIPHPVFEVDGHNLVRAVKVTPCQAVLGSSISVDTLDGSVEMKLPAGLQSGQKLRLRGKGLPMRGEGERGDLFVRMEIAVPKKLTPRQKELWKELAKLENENKESE